MILKTSSFSVLFFWFKILVYVEQYCTIMEHTYEYRFVPGKPAVVLRVCLFILLRFFSSMSCITREKPVHTFA